MKLWSMRHVEEIASALKKDHVTEIVPLLFVDFVYIGDA